MSRGPRRHRRNAACAARARWPPPCRVRSTAQAKARPRRRCKPGRAANRSQPGMAVRPVEHQTLAWRQAIEQIRSPLATGHAANLEMPRATAIVDVAHRVRAQSIRAGDIEQRVLAGKERRRIRRAEPELADVVRDLLDGREHRSEPARKMDRPAGVEQSGSDRAIAARLRLTAQNAVPSATLSVSPGASGQWTSTAPSTSSSLQLPQEPTLHS